MMSRLGRVAFLAAALVLGCDSPDPVEFDWTVVEVDVAPADRVLVVGDTMRLTAHPKNADGAILGSNVQFTWDSDDEAIASVRANGIFGVVEAKQVGTTRIRAVVNGVVGEVTVSVTELRRPVASIEISPADPVVSVNSWVQMEAVLRAADGTVLGGRAVTWSSAQPTIATVTSSSNPVLAVATAQTVGEVVISATSEGVTGSTRLRVLPRVPSSSPVAFVHVRPPTLGAWVDQRLDYSNAAVALASNGTPLEGRTFTWSASDSTVARVWPNGEVRALRPGTTKIRATSEGVTGQATIVVFEQPASTMVEYKLTFDWWDNDVHILLPVARANYTDAQGVTREIELYPESGTLRVDKQFQGANRWEQEIVAVGYVDEGGTRKVIEQRILDRGTYTYDLTGATPFVFSSELKPGFTFTGFFRQYEFHITQALGIAPSQEYRYRLPHE